jgi:hypothetical protein
MRRFTAAIKRVRTQWCWDVPLVCRIGGYATSSTMNESAAVNNPISQRGRAFNENSM